MTLSLSPRLSLDFPDRPTDTPSLPLSFSVVWLWEHNTIPFSRIASSPPIEKRGRKENERSSPLSLARRPKASLPSPFQTFVRSCFSRASGSFTCRKPSPHFVLPSLLPPPCALPGVFRLRLQTISQLALFCLCLPKYGLGILVPLQHHLLISNRVIFDFLSPLSLARGCGAPRR